MHDSTHIKKAPEDHEAPLVSKGNMSDAEFCLEEMRKISKLIEDVSTSPISRSLFAQSVIWVSASVLSID
jgi:hypothetical protein